MPNSSIHAGNDGSHIHSDKTTAMADMTSNARRATEKEQSMTLLQGIRLYPKAVGWSMFISLLIVMEGGLYLPRD